jgi:hypothetical protein
MIDDLELPQVQEIRTQDRRALAEHRPPGMDGSLLQNLGRGPTRLALLGVASGPGARAFVEELDGKFRAGGAVTFTADIVTDSEIETMKIDDLKVQELAGRPDRFAYVLTLREFIEPVEPEDASFVDSDILEEAQGLVDGLVEGLDIGLDFASGLERFVPQLTDLLGRLQEFNGRSEG